jgi:hypothetical protein
MQVFVPQVHILPLCFAPYHLLGSPLCFQRVADRRDRDLHIKLIPEKGCEFIELSGFSSNSSFKASNIVGVMLRERPGEAVRGARGLPKARMLERTALTDWLLRPANFAIWSLVKRPSCSMAWICSRCATAKLGAMMVCDELLAGGQGGEKGNVSTPLGAAAFAASPKQQALWLPIWCRCGKQ